MRPQRTTTNPRRRPRVLLLLLAAHAGLHCSKERHDSPPVQPAPDGVRAAPHRDDADGAWSTGAVPGAAIDVRTEVTVGGAQPPASLAARVPPLTQTLQVTNGRGTVRFTTPSHYIPRNTELRYVARDNRYLLADPVSRRYWAMRGGELANLLEGGPRLERSDYTIEITDRKERRTIAGFETRRSDAKLGLRYATRGRGGERRGSVAITLTVWHTADKRLPPAWGDTLVALMALPFQDREGQPAVRELQRRLSFPLRWSMHVDRGQPARDPGRFVATTSAVAVRIADLPRPALAWPPAQYRAAHEPYTFGDDGQTVAPELLQELRPLASPATPARQPQLPRGAR